MWFDLRHWLGAETPDAAWGGILSIVLIPAAVWAVAFWHTRCHTTWCLRKAKFDVGPYKGCWKCAKKPKRVRRHHLHAELGDSSVRSDS